MKFLGEVFSFSIKSPNFVVYMHTLTCIHTVRVINQVFKVLRGRMDLQRMKRKYDNSGSQIKFSVVKGHIPY